MAHLLREEGVVAAVRLDALLVEAEAEGVPLEERLLREGALTRPQRDRFVRTREVLGRACTRCHEPTYLLPGQGVGTKTCEHCEGRLRGGTSRRRRLGTDHFAEPPLARPSRRLEPRVSRRLEARERLSRRFEEGLSRPQRPSRRQESPQPEIEPPRATTRRPPVPPRPSQALKRGAEALAPRRTQAHGPRRTRAQAPVEGKEGQRRRTRNHPRKPSSKDGEPSQRRTQARPRLEEAASPQRAERAARPTQRQRALKAFETLPPDLARVMRQALDEAREDLILRARREARAEVGRELERQGALELRQRLKTLEEAKPKASAAKGAPPDTSELRRDLEGRVEVALREAERRLDKRLADRDAETEERAGRQAGAAILAATAGRGAAGRSLAIAIEKEIGERAPGLVLESPELSERIQAALQEFLSSQGDAWLREHPALAELREAAPAEQGDQAEDLSASVAALRAEARADSAQVEALARVGAGVQERLEALEQSLAKDDGPSPELERRLRELEDGLVSERRARTKEVAELNSTHLAAAANAARDAALEATREETSRWGLESVEDRVRAEGENALGEVMAQVERLGGRLSALERQLEARVRRQAGALRVRHALRRSVRLGAILWAVLLVPLLIAGALYPRVYQAKVPLGPPTREPYGGPVEKLRTILTNPTLLDEVADKAGLPAEAGWAERLAGLPATRGERLQVRLEPFGDPPHALFIHARGLGAAQAEAAAAELSLRLESAAEAAGAPLGQISSPSAEPQGQLWGWVLGAAGLLALLAFGLASLRELRRKGFQDAAELGDLVDLPVLLTVAPEERDS
jgi:hypothetical protein